MVPCWSYVQHLWRGKGNRRGESKYNENSCSKIITRVLWSISCETGIFQAISRLPMVSCRTWAGGQEHRLLLAEEGEAASCWTPVYMGMVNDFVYNAGGAGYVPAVVHSFLLLLQFGLYPCAPWACFLWEGSVCPAVCQPHCSMPSFPEVTSVCSYSLSFLYVFLEEEGGFVCTVNNVCIWSVMLKMHHRKKLKYYEYF